MAALVSCLAVTATADASVLMWLIAKDATTDTAMKDTPVVVYAKYSENKDWQRVGVCNGDMGLKFGYHGPNDKGLRSGNPRRWSETYIADPPPSGGTIDIKLTAEGYRDYVKTGHVVKGWDGWQPDNEILIVHMRKRDPSPSR